MELEGISTVDLYTKTYFVHFSVVFKGFVFAKYASCPIDCGSSRSCHNSEIIFI